MEDSDVLIAMNFMSELLSIAHLIDESIGICLMAHMIQLSMRYGVCKESSYALACCSALLYSLGDLKASKRVSYFALSLLERLDCKEMLPRVGMQTGDIKFALCNARTHCAQRFCCGVGLDVLIRDIRVWEHQMIEYKQEMSRNSMKALRHTVLALINFSVDTMQQNGDFLAEGKKLLNGHIEKNRQYLAT
eukprot:7247922-Ditylum_brightwellii.AAC.1